MKTLIDIEECENLLKGTDIEKLSRYILCKIINISKEADKKVTVLFGEEDFRSELINKMREASSKDEISFVNCKNINDVYYCLKDKDALIIDSIPKDFDLVEDEMREDILNSISKHEVYSLFIPYGIDSSSGLKFDKYLSNQVLSFGFILRGNYLNDGLDSAKNVSYYPYDFKYKSLLSLVEKEDLVGLIKPRKRNINKGSNGKSYLIGGSSSYQGAPYLSYSSSLCVQAGGSYVTLCVPMSISSYFILKDPQIIIRPLSEKDGLIYFDEGFAKSVLDSSGIAIGMGCKVSEELYRFINFLLMNYKGTLIIDADGLNSLSRFGMDGFKGHLPKVIITPHIHEFSRLTGLSDEEIENNGVKIARKFAKENDVTVILKSASTIMTDGKSSFISDFGNSGLAKAGSGDMLSGILLGLSTYDYLSTMDISKLGAFILGRAAEIAGSDCPIMSMCYSDIISNIRKAISEIIV